ncbi:hypothetical protein P4283_26270 [Bacillus thuringiensis]|nr:hypothetical protein [Bacillus thuringiensis]
MKVRRGTLCERGKQYEQVNKKKREEKLSTRDIEDLMGGFVDHVMSVDEEHGDKSKE